MKLSKSKIKTFETCPFLFKLKYVDGTLQDGIKNDAMIRGIDIHEMLDTYFKPKSQEKTDIKIKDIKQLNEEIQKHPKFEEHREAISNFINFNERMSNIIPIYTEETLEDDTYNLKGIIDRVNMTTDGKLVLLDYKTGQKHPITDYRFELALYTYLFEVNHNTKIDFWGIYFPDHDTELIEPVNRDEIQSAINHVIKIRKEIKNCIDLNKFKKCPNYSCKWCEAKKRRLCI